MAKDLKIDYSKTKALAKSVKGKSDQFRTLLGKIKTANNTLKTHWQGDDATKYTGAITEQAKTMDKLNTTIDEISTFLTKVANAYEQAMETNKNGINK